MLPEERVLNQCVSMPEINSITKGWLGCNTILSDFSLVIEYMLNILTYVLNIHYMLIYINNVHQRASIVWWLRVANSNLKN